MKLVIACPIYKRDWILPLWIQSILSQSVDISKIGFVFECSENDSETINILETWKKYDSRIPYFNIKTRPDIPHHEHEENKRSWTISKYENMVSLRNSILNTVREINPDYYMSLDSDILMTNSSTLELLIAHVNQGADAASPLMYMTPVGVKYPSVMTWREDEPDKAYRRSDYPIGTYFKSDIIMAAKMMSKRVYENVDYSIHRQGEDVGWSLSCKENGYDLYSASYIYCPHIMSRTMYQKFIQSGDPRSDLNVYHLV
jgi:hypothetical protein